MFEASRGAATIDCRHYTVLNNCNHQTCNGKSECECPKMLQKCRTRKHLDNTQQAPPPNSHGVGQNESQRLVCSGGSGCRLNLLRELPPDGLKGGRRHFVTRLSIASWAAAWVVASAPSPMFLAPLCTVQCLVPARSPCAGSDVNCASGTLDDSMSTQSFDRRSTHFFRFSMASSCWSRRNCATPIRSTHAPHASVGLS